MNRHPVRSLRFVSSWLLAALAAAVLPVPGCGFGGGGGGSPGPKPDSTASALGEFDPSPGVNLEILAVTGASGADGSFQAGDTLHVTFTLKQDDGTAWSLSDMSSARILVSGPTFNYQRVMAEKNDVATRATWNGSGSWTYTFADPLPATYLAPLNDSLSFGAGDGELQGENLLAGTYTVGMYFRWPYTAGGETKRDADDDTFDFLFGGAMEVVTRDVVASANCNQCHSVLQAHGGQRRDPALCVLCHTSGAEDRNNGAVGGGTPGVSIDFRVMIHRIHNAEHLPSVLGVTTDATGARVYDEASATPYWIAGGSVNDFSDVAFPVWPNLNIAMPRDMGYTALSTANKALEDEIRRGVTDCAKCHGDPDGAGALEAPAHGDLFEKQPTRRACGACHDDVNFAELYTANDQTMPAQNDDATCMECHAAEDGALGVAQAHRHPLTDPDFNTGLNFEISSVTPGDGSPTFGPGDRLQLTLTVTDDAGEDVAPAGIAGMTTVVSGPTANMNVLSSIALPAAALTGDQPYTVYVPQRVYLEKLGVATTDPDVFTADLLPLWDTQGAATVVQAMTGAVVGGGDATTTAAAVPLQNYIDVDDATGFAHDDYVVIGAGTGAEEYMRVQNAIGNRLWFGSLASATYPRWLQSSHGIGTTVTEMVTTTKTLDTHYTVDAVTGVITEGATPFDDGSIILATYTTDFRLPAAHLPPINDSPDLGEAWGDWTGKSLADGTYIVGLWGNRTKALALYGESQNYSLTAHSAQAEFLVGGATDIEPYALISSGENCNKCHNDLYFHGGGRRGFDTCMLCHAGAGGEDRAPYVAGNAPDTTGVTINFRGMLHKIHRGEDLANASSYEVVGFGSTAFPNNFGESTYEAVVFPALPDGVKQCAMCHGDANTAWKEPSDRNHPTEQGLSALVWRASCNSCHDSDAATAHIEVQTSAGGDESCVICHGAGKPFNVTDEHLVRK